jgi:DNA repair protein RadC
MMEKRKFWKALKSGEFASMVKESSRGQEVSSSEEIYNVMKPMFADAMDVERMYGIFLTTKNRIIVIKKLAEGTINHTAIYPREVVKQVLALGAAAIALCHNHPSGVQEPSREDKALTMQIGLALSGIGVVLHDHVIVGEGYYSMADEGIIETIRGRLRSLLAV